MWYVNKIKFHALRHTYATFYINYVVCKLDCFQITSCIASCFILTMWYVNLLRYALRSLISLSFILTMWYVNGFKDPATIKQYVASFILTMWYVNWTLIGFIQQYNAFYINYVVCKFTHEQYRNRQIYRFYINYVVCKFRKITIIWNMRSCFILTMWYVNHS